MNNQQILEWLVFGYLTLFGIRYLLGARVYLSCALRAAEVRAARPEEIDPHELPLISFFDEELVAEGFRHLGFGLISPILTHYETASAASVFANSTIPAYAIVRCRAAPEYSGPAQLEIITEFSAGPALVTQNTASTQAFLPKGTSVEAQPDASISDILRRHRKRVAEASESRAPAQPGSLDKILNMYCSWLANLRASYRQRRWAVPTTDSSLDRFTLRGALMLTHHSMRFFGKSTNVVRHQHKEASEALRSLRVQADFNAARHVADVAEAAPGVPWGLLTAVMLTVFVSFATMAVIWDPYTALIILAVLAFHEGGHVVAMRAVGYRNIHVLFVPLLGALTVGRPARTTSLQRVVVSLAGPVPGLWLGVVLLVTDRMAGPIPVLRIVALALLLINGLNLLPITPFDGGRALESLTRPGSLWRPIIHVLSVIGLLAAAYRLEDPVLAIIGVVWGLLLRRQVLAWRLRRSLAGVVRDPHNHEDVMRQALQCMTAPQYSSWRSVTRQATARMLAREFSESGGTVRDWRWGTVAYACGWIPVLAGIMLWWN